MLDAFEMFGVPYLALWLAGGLFALSTVKLFINIAFILWDDHQVNTGGYTWQ